MINDSIISFSGVKSSLKVGGSYKTYTANFYKNGEFVESKPHWTLSYFKNDFEICKVYFIYSGDDLVVDGDVSVSKDRKITFGEDVFGIQYSYNASKPYELKIKCLSILNMLGGKLVIKAESSPTGMDNLTTSIEVEVEGL
jgi:hypothetical protein